MSKLVDLTGQIFGRLTVLGRADNYVTPSGHERVQWQCKCECGKGVIVLGNNLKTGRTQSCGCLQAELTSTRKLTDLSGQRFARLTVISRADDYVDKRGRRCVRWKCVCDCGNEAIVRALTLTNGTAKSCGCLRKKNIENVQTHKKSKKNHVRG